MNTLKLYSMLKVNQKKAKETKYNYSHYIGYFCHYNCHPLYGIMCH